MQMPLQPRCDVCLQTLPQITEFVIPAQFGQLKTFQLFSGLLREGSHCSHRFVDVVQRAARVCERFRPVEQLCDGAFAFLHCRQELVDVLFQCLERRRCRLQVL